MKRQVLKKMLGLAVAAAVCMTSPVMAAETEIESETVAEAAAERETEIEEETEAAPDVEILQDGKAVVTLKNESGVTAKEAVLTLEEGETEEEAAKGTLVLTEEDGTEHTFEDVDAAAMTEPRLVKEDGFLFIKYQDEAGEEKTAYETADEVEFEEPITLYVVNDVYVRQEADGDSEALTVATLGGEVTGIGATPKWYKVEIDGITGYISRAYLSKDKENADAAVQAEEAAIAQAQAEAAARAQAESAAAAAAQASQSAPAASAPQGKYEVSRVAYDDCDGSGHGYYEITYSDGSVAIEEY